jgi:replication initiation protein RepC
MLEVAQATEELARSQEGDRPLSPGQALAAFKAAAPFLGYSPRIVHAVDWLFGLTYPQDWAPDTRPIVWPSAARQGADLRLGPSATKALNRQLAELGLVIMRDSPNGKRYGHRDKNGKILEAYGFDLSPLATRVPEFREVARRGLADRAHMRALRRRATVAKRGLTQVIETAIEWGVMDPALEGLAAEVQTLALSLKEVEATEEVELGVHGLERRHAEAREKVQAAIAKLESGISVTESLPQNEMPVPDKTVDAAPKGPEKRPHQYNYKSTLNPFRDTVEASEKNSFGSDQGRSDRLAASGIRPDELIHIAPRLRTYLTTSTPTWVDIVEAADWLRTEMHVSKMLWGEACLVMGREQAAVAIAVISAKRPGLLRVPGAYFFGMIRKAKAGELNLSQTIWGLRLGEAKGDRARGYHN